MDDGQTNSVSFGFDTICLAVERRSEPRTADGLTTDIRILLVLIQSVWPSSTVPKEVEISLKMEKLKEDVAEMAVCIGTPLI